MSVADAEGVGDGLLRELMYFCQIEFSFRQGIFHADACQFAPVLFFILGIDVVEVGGAGIINIVEIAHQLAQILMVVTLERFPAIDIVSNGGDGLQGAEAPGIRPDHIVILVGLGQSQRP